MIDSTILAFTLAALLVAVTPGPDTFLVIMNTLKRGLRHGLATVFGIASGGLFHAALFGFGVAQVLVYSPTVFMVVKLLGAGYLLWLGIGALRGAFWPTRVSGNEVAAANDAMNTPPLQGASRPACRDRSSGGLHASRNPRLAPNPLPQGERGLDRTGSLRSVFLQGLITNAFNPKVAVFYLAFLPQFMRPTDDIAVKSVLLIGIHYAIGLVWLSLVALFVVQFNTWLRKSVVQRVLEGTVGAIMTFFGAKLALASR